MANDIDLTKEVRVCRKHGGEPLLLIQFFPRNKHDPSGWDKMCKQCWKNRPKKNSSQLATTPKARTTFTGKTKFVAARPIVDDGIVPDGIEKIILTKLSALPGDRKFFEWRGAISQGLERYEELYDLKPKIVYAFQTARYFIG